MYARVGWGGVGHVIAFMWPCGGRTCFSVATVSSLELSTHTSCYVTVSSLELSTHASCHAIVTATFHSCVMPRYVSSLELSTHTSCYVTVSSLELSMHTSCYVTVSSLELSTHTSCYVTVSSLELSTHAWCHTIVSSLGRIRSVAVTDTGIKTCQVEYFENSHKPQKWYFRVGEMLVFENMNQNKGLTALKTTSKHVRSN